MGQSVIAKRLVRAATIAIAHDQQRGADRRVVVVAGLGPGGSPSRRRHFARRVDRRRCTLQSAGFPDQAP